MKEEEIKVKIYVLYDPKTSTIRYIGRTKRTITKRLNEHVCNAKKEGKNQHLYNWINSLLKEGTRPKTRLLTTIKGWKESHDFERTLINRHKDKHNLVNSEDRGEGGLNRVVLQETVDKIRKSLIKYYSDDKNKTSFYNKIFCYSKDGSFYKEYLSSKFAVEELKIDSLSLRNHINKFDNHGAKVNPIGGYYFSKIKMEKFPITKKYQSNHQQIEVMIIKTGEKIIFSTIRDFSAYFSLGSWDISQSRLGVKTERFNKLLKQIKLIDAPYIRDDIRKNWENSGEAYVCEDKVILSRALT